MLDQDPVPGEAEDATEVGKIDGNLVLWRELANDLTY